jgi:DNA-damage-inducible protein J
MAATTMLHVRVDDTLKTQAAQVLGAMGLTVADAVRMLLTRVAADQAFPLELKVPRSLTREAIEDARLKKLKDAPQKSEVNKMLATQSGVAKKRKTV